MAAGTRRSARISCSQASQNSSPSTSQTSPAPPGKKRKAESGTSPSAKRGKKDEKEQQIIEDVMDLDKEPRKDSHNKSEETEIPEKQPESNDTQAEDAKGDAEQEKLADSKKEETNGHAEHYDKNQDAGQEKREAKPEQEKQEGKPEQEKQEDKPEHEKKEDKPEQHKEEAKPEASPANGDAVKPHARDGDVPSSILEKGVMYFLYRGRVNIDSPDSVTDIQRSFLLMRPLPHGAKLGDGPISTTSKDCRLIAIPKKTLPVSGNDRWTGFVEKANISFPELKEGFLKESKYETQTQGTQTTPAITPAAEGVYAITTTGRETHLAYIVTLPSELGEIQHDLGVRQSGSFILSTKNPKAPGPANANLGTDPGFSEEIMKDFRSLRWMPTQPKHLDYEYCQFLMIGEGEKGLEKATEPQEKDVKNDKSAPLEEMEKLEDEDEMRIKHLDEEDAVFKDLGMDSKSYPGLQTTW